MSKDAGLAFNNHYNRRLQDMISDLENMDVINNTQPMLFGGGPLRSHIVPSGNLGTYPPIEMMAEQSAMGNSGGRRFNLTKFLRPTVRALNSKQGRSIIQPLTKALVNRAVKTIEGGKINRLKKARRWTGYAADTVSKGLDLGAKAKRLFGMGMEEDLRKVVRVAKRVAKEPLVRELVAVARKAPVVRQAVAKAKKIVGGGRAKRAEIVKAVMAKHGLKMIDASKFVKAHNLY
jgi:hypothetical protein